MPSRATCRSRAGWTMSPSPRCRAGWRWTATSSGIPIWPISPSPVHFHSSRTNVEVVAIPGDLSIDSGDLQLNDATGPARISTSAKDVECTGITGDLRVEDGDGDISVGAVAPLGEIADSQPQRRDQPDRAPGRRLSAAGDGQKREHRVQAGSAGKQRRRGPERLRQGGRRRSRGSSWSPITATSKSPPWMLRRRLLRRPRYRPCPLRRPPPGQKPIRHFASCEGRGHQPRSR